MARVLFLAWLPALLMWHAPASAETTYSCGQGTVRTVEATDEAVTRETITTRRGEDGGVETFVMRSDTLHRRSYVLTVQLRDVLYTSESAGDPYGTLNPLRIVAGEPIDICVSATQMIVERPDGTDYRAPVVRYVPALDAGCPKPPGDQDFSRSRSSRASRSRGTSGSASRHIVRNRS